MRKAHMRSRKRLTLAQILKNLKGEQGVSIVEAMVAASIVLVSFLGLSQVVSLGRNLLDMEEDRRRAALVMQATLDGVRADIDFDNLVNLDDTSVTIVVEDRNYQLSYQVAIDNPDVDTATVDLTVSWNSPYKGGTVARDLTCSTIFARSGS